MDWSERKRWARWRGERDAQALVKARYHATPLQALANAYNRWADVPLELVIDYRDGFRDVWDRHAPPQ